MVSKVIYNLRRTLCQVSFGGAGDPIDYENLFALGSAGFINIRYDDNGYTKRECWADEELLEGIARCVTINPRNRAFTKDQILPLARFSGVGISCGYVGHISGPNTYENILRVLDQIAEVREYRPKPEVILHVIVPYSGGEFRSLLRLVAHPVVDGILLLAEKVSPDTSPLDKGPFYDRETQKTFWRTVRIVQEASRLPIAVDSCLARMLHPSMFKVDHRAMHPCDAGRFSTYIHADGKMWLCSCGAKPVKDLNEAVRTPQVCSGVLPPATEKDCRNGSEPPLIYNWPNPNVVIQRGPMTNSSSASYFVIGKPDQMVINIIDLDERRKLARQDAEMAIDPGFQWTKHNNRLVRLTQHEWAAWCARDIANSKRPVQRKKELYRYPLRILQGDDVYYLVANRHGSGVPPMHYDREDVSPYKTVVVLPAGESH
jgi:hypothetical protein